MIYGSICSLIQSLFAFSDFSDWIYEFYKVKSLILLRYFYSDLYILIKSNNYSYLFNTIKIFREKKINESQNSCKPNIQIKFGQTRIYAI